MNSEEMRVACATAVGRMKWSYALPEKVTHCDVPRYSTDPSAALQLVDHLAKEGWEFRVCKTKEMDWECEFSMFPENDTYKAHAYYAPSFAEAVCGAFLKVVQEKEENHD